MTRAHLPYVFLVAGQPYQTGLTIVDTDAGYQIEAVHLYVTEEPDVATKALLMQQVQELPEQDEFPELCKQAFTVH